MPPCFSGLWDGCENICFKCLEKSPLRRCASAQAVADDLGRFLRGEPVQARPVSLVHKTWRLARRRPWHAAAVFLALTMLAGIIFSLSWKARTEQLHQKEISQLLMRSQLGEARTLVRLHEADSRRRAETIVRKVLAGNPPPEIRREARDVAVAALALPSASTEWFSGPGVEINDWTMVTGDLPRGRWALAEFRGRVSLRPVDSSHELSALDTAPRRITALIRFSPGGRWLAIRHGEELGIWDTAPGSARPLAFVARPWSGGRPFGLTSLAFAPDDSAVLWLDGEEIVATALPEGREMARWSAAAPHTLAFDPDGKHFVTGHRNAPSAELRAWPGGEVVESFAGIFPQALNALAVASGTGRMAGGDFAGRITVWHPGRAGELLEFRGHQQTIRSLAFSEDGRFLASMADDGALRLWDCAAGEMVFSQSFECGVPGFSPGMKQIGPGCAGNHVGLIQPELSPCLHRFQPAPLTKHLQTVVIHPDSQSLAALTDGGFARYHIPGGKELQRFSYPGAHTLAFEPDGQAIVVAGKAMTRYSFDPAEAPAPLQPEVAYGWDGLHACANGAWMAACDTTRFEFVMWPPGARAGARRGFVLENFNPSLLALSPDGSRCAGLGRYLPGLRIFNTENGATLREIPLPAYHALEWSPDGRYLAASGPTTQLWETARWSALTLPVMEPNAPPAGAVAFFPPDAAGVSPMVALPSGSHGIRLVSLPALTDLATLQAPGDLPVYQLAISRDQRWLAAATAQCQIHLWDLQALRSHLRSLGLDW